MQILHFDRTRCHVCGFSEVRTDQAIDRELVWLAECPRCDHRWTSAVAPRPGAARIAGLPPLRREVDSAA